MNKRFILYGVIIALGSIALKILEYKFIIINHSFELYGGALAIGFTILGIYAGKKLTKPKEKEIIVEKTVYVPATPSNSITTADKKTIETTGLSKREYEILELMAHGYSNQEIADKIFVSISTVKTHISNIFIKLDATRRTQAVKKAKELNLIS